VTDDRVFIGTYDLEATNYIHAIDRATGARVWRTQLASGISGSPRLAGDLLLVPAGDLIALDAATGAPRWQFAQPQDTRGIGTPVLSGTHVLVQGADAVSDGRLYSLDLATGKMEWELDAGIDTAGGYVPTIQGSIVVGVYERGNSQVDFGNGAPMMVEVATGNVIWQNMDVSVSTSPVLANGQLFFQGQNFKGASNNIDDNVGLIVLDASTGEFQTLDNYFRYSNACTPLVMAANGVFGAGADGS
jgi:outer membrane protein assembly factor BamB